MKNKKLLQINTVINTGSTGRIAEGIGLQAIKQGWESHIAYGRYGNASQSKAIKIGTKWDNYRNVAKTRLTGKHGLGSKQATRDFVKKIKAIQPDIIHLHNIHGYYLNYEILFAYLVQSNIQTVWTLHDCWTFTGQCTHFEYVSCEKWKTEKGCFHCPEIGNYPKSFVDYSPKNFKRKKQAFTFLGNLTLVPVSKWLEGKVKQSFLGKYKTNQIYTGLDLDTFQPKKVSDNLFLKYGINPNNKIYLGVASTWTERKGLKDYHQLQSFMRKDEVLVLIGLTTKQIKALPKGIIGIERTEMQSELVELYNVAIVFINLTLEDNFPTTNIEALACGTPVITYATGGSPEAIDRETGWVVSQGDLEGIRQILDKLVHSDRKQLKAACRKRAVIYFDKNERFSEYISLYEKLMKSIEINT